MGKRWEPLSRGCRVLVTDGHGFNTDTLLLADFSMPRRGEACADFGTGCGAIPLLWAARGRPGKAWGIELQEEAAALAAESVRANGLEGKITILQGDVREIKSLLPHQSLGLAACNPPYQAAGAGLVSGSPARRLARHGEALPLEGLAAAARYALGHGGRLCVCMRTQRLAEAAAVFHAAGLEPKRLRLVQARPGKAPYLFLLESRKGGKPGLETEPVLFLEGPGGGPSPELEAIYGDYREGRG